MAKFKLTVSRDGKTDDHVFEAADKDAAKEYGDQLARFGGFEPDAPGVEVEVKAVRG